jgi:hypothetical protein
MSAEAFHADGPRVRIGFDGDGASELRFGRAGPQARRIDVAQLGLGIDHRLRQPGRDLRLQLRFHRCIGVFFGGLEFGGDLQARRGAGERALHRGLRDHIDVVVFGQRCLHTAVKRRVDRHRRRALQLDARAVVAIGDIHALHFERVLGVLVDVAAREVRRLQHGRAGPAHLVDAEGDIHVDRQHELLQRLGGLFARRAALLDQHLLRVHFAQLHLALEEGRELPADGGVVHLDGDALALVLEPADVAAGAQRAGHVAALERLARRQALRGLRERERERGVRAQPPPRARAEQQHGEDETREGPCQRAHHAARARAPDRGRHGRHGRHWGGDGFFVRHRKRRGQKVKPRRKCRRNFFVSTP